MDLSVKDKRIVTLELKNMAEELQDVEQCDPVEGASYDWTIFTRTKFIRASREEIYNAWTQSGQLTKWFLKSATYETAEGPARASSENFQAGDAYTWTWHGYDGEEQNKVLEANGVDRVVFGFAEQCRVTVTITPKEDGHEVVLVQDQIPATEDAKVNWHLGCSTGWVTYLMNLKSVLEGGLDLRTLDK